MKLSKKIEKIKPSAIVKVADKVRDLLSKGEKIIRLDTGEPHFNTPLIANKAVADALAKGYTRYSHSRGNSELREKLCEKYNKEYKTSFHPNRNIIITPGAKQAIYYALVSAVDEGDEVIILTPAWVSYEELVVMAGGKPVFAECGKNDFQADFKKIKSKITKKTKAIIINSPNNPTGKIIKKETLKKISNLCVKKDILLISDEIYDRIIYQGDKFTSVLSANPKLKNCIYINGFSKTYAMTGWRLGYIFSDDKFIEAILKVQQNLATCPNTFIQYGAIKALSGGENFIKKSLKAYQENVDILIKEFKKIPNFKLVEPDGSLFALIDVSKANKSSYDFCLNLLDKCKVSAVPGVVFGKNCEGYIRICFATDKKNIIEFIKRFKKEFC